VHELFLDVRGKGTSLNLKRKTTTTWTPLVTSAAVLLSVFLNSIVYRIYCVYYLYHEPFKVALVELRPFVEGDLMPGKWLINDI
jgi:hypothetical protein